MPQQNMLLKENKRQQKILLITSGESAGIGLDIIIKLYASQALKQLDGHVLVLADTQALLDRATALNISIAINPVEITWDDQQMPILSISNALPNTTPNALKKDQLNVCATPCQQPVVAGQLNMANAQQVVKQLHLAGLLALSKQVSAIVTAPVQKSIINDAIDAGECQLTHTRKPNQRFSGHTEFFQQLAGCDDVVMMLANESQPQLKVALVTTHLPLKAVPDAITKAKLTTVIDILLADLKQKFGKADPTIMVCGLNPHAGEGGHLGMEEIQTINPVLQGYRDKGINISLAKPADTLFSSENMADTDCFLAMYHDQGLTVLKALGFGQTVNVTLGLPMIRTSVDHGTALDIAGTGKAQESSLLAALKMAEKITDSQPS